MKSTTLDTYTPKVLELYMPTIRKYGTRIKSAGTTRRKLTLRNTRSIPITRRYKKTGSLSTQLSRGRFKRHRRGTYHRSKVSHAVVPFRTERSSPFPYKIFRNFTYSDTNFDGSTNAGNAYTCLYAFRGNAMYDPDLTGAGVQPYCYDDLCKANLYYWNLARASKITIYPRTKTETGLCPAIRMFIIPSILTGLTFVDPSDLRNTRFCKCFNFNFDTQGTKGHTALTHYMSIKKLFPTIDAKYSPFREAWNAVPGSTWQWLIYFSSVDDSQECDIQFDCKIEYYSELQQADNQNES